MRIRLRLGGAEKYAAQPTKQPSSGMTRTPSGVPLRRTSRQDQSSPCLQRLP
ncbi:MAG: hypothetical protein IJH48_09325 [Oscillospiraceae bacterium]|nr:hypothetical protein [Oscillospiraceae bacterium]